jgi:hypothetical protein
MLALLAIVKDPDKLRARRPIAGVHGRRRTRRTAAAFLKLLRGLVGEASRGTNRTSSNGCSKPWTPPAA